MAETELNPITNTPDFQTMLKEDIDDKENPFEQKIPNLNWSNELTLHKVLEEKFVGELSEDINPSKGITWEVPNFFDITEEIDHYMYSPVFSFANSIWCLQMFPNGKRQGSSNGWIDLFLIRLYSHDSKLLVQCTLGIKDYHGQIYKSVTDLNTFEGRDLEWGAARLLKRSRVFDDEKLIAKDGTVRVFCRIQAEERKASVISKQFLSSISSSFIKIPDALKVGKLSEELCSAKDISWTIPGVFTLLEERAGQIASPVFNFENATWILQMYLIEQKAEKNEIGFGLKLVRLYSSVARHDIHFKLGIKDYFGKIYKSFSGRYIFDGKSANCESICLLKKSIGEERTDIAPLGCFAPFGLLKRTVGESLELLLRYQADEATKIPFCSRLENSKEFTWEISNFFQLPVKKGYFTDSEEFSLANARWCLRMYPDGKEGSSSGWICLMLVRRSSCYSEHRIHYKLSLKTRRGKKHGSSIHAVTFHGNAAEMGVVNFIMRSDVSKSMFSKNLTVFCEILMIQITVPLSGHNELLTPTSDMSGHAQQLHLHSSLSKPEIYTWKINNFLQLPTEDDFFIDSAEFSLANAIWCMRMYPNGLKGHNKKCIQLFLVRLSSSNPEHRIQYGFGIESQDVIRHETLLHDVSFHANGVEMGVVNLLKRSELISRKKKLLPKGILTAFCHIYMIQDFRVKASNSTLPEKRFEPYSKIPLVMKLDDSTVGVLEKESFLEAKEVIWEIPLFISRMAEKWRDSPQFLFLNEYWCLRIYVKGKETGKKNRKIEMYLVRINHCPLMYVIAYELGIMSSGGSWVKFRTCECKSISEGNVMYLGVSELEFATVNFLAIYFQMLSKEGVTQTFVLPERPLLLGQMRSGMLHEQPFLAAAEVTWTIPDFFELKNKGDHIKSPVFDFANNTWSLQMYPNGYGKTVGKLSFVLVKLSPSVLKCHIICLFSTKNTVAATSREKLDSVFKGKSSISLPVHLEQSIILAKPEESVPDGVLTVFCQMFIIEDTVKVVKRLDPLAYDLCNTMNELRYGVLSQQSFLAATEITWEISDLFALGKEDGYYMNSPTFILANDTWLLQLYPNECETKAGKMSLVLVRLLPSETNHRVICKLSIKSSDNLITDEGSIETFFKDKVIKSCPVHLRQFQIAKKQEESLSKGLLTVFCQMYIIEEQIKAVTKQPLETTQPKSVTVFPLNDVEQYSHGVLFQRSFLAATELKWEIPGFLRLENKAGYFIKSPAFDLANGIWLLQLYPNVCEKTEGKISCILVRLVPSSLALHVICKFIIKSDNDTIIESGSCESTFKDKVINSCPVHLEKSKILKKQGANVPKGILTLFCQIHIADNKTEVVIEAPVKKNISESKTS